MAKQETPSVPQRHILVVEDDVAISAVMVDFLNAAGYRTSMARDGAEAVALSRVLRPDLIVMDLMMPRLTGGEAAAKLREGFPTEKIPILAVSAVSDIAALADVLPFDAVIQKPFDLDELLTVIEQLLSAPAPETAGNEHLNPG
jgi:CheY-like chemotaxis protein